MSAQFGRAATSSGPTITTIDDSNAGTGQYQGTAIVAIDPNGNQAGFYIDASGNEHAFVRSASGTITELPPPSVDNVATPPDFAIAPLGFDAAGDLLGVYADSGLSLHGFIFTASGTFSSIDAPGAGTAKELGTYPEFIDAAGDISGVWTDSEGRVHGFVMMHGSTLTSFDATTASNELQGTAYATVNANGQVAGTYEDTSGVLHGYVRSTSGTITTIDVTGAGTAEGQGTYAYTLDANGDVGGAYSDSNGVVHGFVRLASGTITTFDSPDTTSTVGIIPFDYPMQMDAAGDMIGVYVDTTNSLMHGFIRSLSGTITTFDAPGAGGVPAALHRQLARAFRHGKSNVRGRGISARGKGFMKGLAGVLPVMRTGLHSPIGASAKGMSLPSLPGGINGSGTAGISINSSGMITGVYGSSDAEIHGFVRSAAGAMTDYDVPAAGTGAYEGTISFAVNGAGEVGGAYLDENNVFHGFTATLAGVATTVDLTADPTSAVYAQPVTLTATVAGGTIPDGESVQFLNGTTALGTSTTTTGGVATFTTMDLPLATNSITAVYGGDSTYEGSTSAAVNVTVGQSGTTTALTSSANPSGTGDSVTLTAAVSGTYGGTPTGSVTFYNGSSSLGSGTLSGGTATSATTALPIGTDSLTAVYSGDSNYKTSTSTALSQVVSGPTFSLAASGTQSLTVSPGGQGSVMFTITPMYGFNSAITFACSGLPTGASCSFNPTSVTPTAATTETVTIAVPANSAMLQRGHDTGRDTGGGAHWPMLGIALVGSLAGWRKRRRLSGWVVLALAVACLGMSACGKSSSSTPTTSNVTVTATAGSVQQTLTIALTVN